MFPHYIVSPLQFVISSKCIETICLPGTITRPNTRGSSITPLSGMKQILFYEMLVSRNRLPK